MKTEKEIRKQIYDNCIALGIPKEISKKISNNTTNISTTENYNLPIGDMISSLFFWDETPEGQNYWFEIYDNFVFEGVVIAPRKKQKPTLSHTEIQTLISILKVAAQDASANKMVFCDAASNTWDSCIKGTVDGQDSFEDFSYYKTQQKRYKEKERKIGQLLGKLKDMR